MSSAEEIAASLTRIYRLFIDIGYIAETDLKCAPHGPEELDIGLCLQLGMHGVAIEFLQKIPWTNAGSGDLIRDSEMIDFSEPHSLTAARNPQSAKTPQKPADPRTELNGQMISLTFCFPTGYALVVDTLRGTIRKWYGDSDLMEMPERNACTVLDGIYRRYLHLDDVPYELEIIQPTPVGLRIDPETGDAHPIINIKFILVYEAAKDAGWPDTFSKEVFKRTAARWLYIMGLNDEDEGWSSSSSSSSSEEERSI